MSYIDAHDDYSDQVLIAVITRCIEGHGIVDFQPVRKRVSTGDLEFLFFVQVSEQHFEYSMERHQRMVFL